MIPLLALSLVLHAPAPKSAPSAVYVIENVVGKEGTVEKYNIVRFSLGRDNSLVQEIILTVDYGHLSIGVCNRIIDERYLVTWGAEVIDLDAGKVVHQNHCGQLLGVEDGKVVYRVENTRRATGVFAFDPKTHKIDKVAAGTHWDLPGEKSADKSMSVVSHSNGEVHLYRLGKGATVLGKDCHPGLEGMALRLEGGGLPLLWLDNKRVLTIQSNQKLITLTIDGVMEKSADVADMPQTLTYPPDLWRDAEGRVIYSGYAKNIYWKHFQIDLKAKTASPLKRHALGHGFEASVAEDEKGKRTVYYKGTEVSRWVFDPFAAKTAPGHIAVPYRSEEDTAQQAGVAVWSDRAKDWRTSKKMWVESVVGWAK